MKRTRRINISYLHYFPAGVSGGLLCGLQMPPGGKTRIEVEDDA